MTSLQELPIEELVAIYKEIVRVVCGPEKAEKLKMRYTPGAAMVFVWPDGSDPNSDKPDFWSKKRLIEAIENCGPLLAEGEEWLTEVARIHERLNEKKTKQ